MSTREYTKQEIDYIKKHYKSKTYKQIANELGRSTKSVNGKARQLGLTKKKIIIKNRVWTKEKDAELARIYPFKSNKEVADLLNLTVRAIQSRAKHLCLYKDPSFVKNGLYKKGNLPHSTRPIGYVRHTLDGPMIKIANSRTKADWITYQLYVWLSAGNKMPQDGYFVRLKPEYKNLPYEQWESRHMALVNRRQNLEKNTIHRYPKEVVSAIQLLSSLRKQINEKH